MSKNDVISAENNLTKKDFRSIFWRSFTLLGSMNYERMEALGFLYSIMPALKKIYKDDPEGMKAACHRHMVAFNMTVAPSPFVMGIAVAMEELAKKDKNFDVNSINAVKVSLMGPLSGIGDTFFWGIFRILACALAVGFAQQGNPIAPFVLLIVFNIPNFATRYFCLKWGYQNGTQALVNMEKSGKMQLFTHCAGIVGVAAVGCLIALWAPISCPLTFTLSGTEIVLQDYLDQILPCLLPLITTLSVFGYLRKGGKVIAAIIAIVIIGFILGVLGLIA